MFTKIFGMAIVTLLLFLVTDVKADVIWGDVAADKAGAIQVDQNSNKLVTKVGNTIQVITETAAVNPSTAFRGVDLTGVLESSLTGNTIEAIRAGASLLGSIARNDPATKTVIFTTGVKTVTKGELISDVDFIARGVFVTQRRLGDTSEANVEGDITFNGQLAHVSFEPSERAGTSEQPTGKNFTGKAHIDLPHPAKAVLFTFRVKMDASEAGSPADSFSASILEDWIATASVVPEPSSVVLFGTGSLGLLGYYWRRMRHPRSSEGGTPECVSQRPSGRQDRG